MMTEELDYTEEDRWDWDRNDDRQHCKHGTFIGSWWGPDVLCQWCEDGISVEEMRRILREQALYRAQRKADDHDRLVAVISQFPYNPAVANALVEMAWYSADATLFVEGQ